MYLFWTAIWYSYQCMRRFSFLFFLAFAVPTIISAQSLEWVAEHPGAVTPALSMTSTTPAATAAPAPQANTNEGLETKIRAYFSDAPVMVAIAECESRFRQFDDNGKPLDGGAGSMIGVFQINAPVHAAYAKSIGMDIYTLDGNLAYARKLYMEEGTDPWLDSFSCWHQTTQSQVVAAGTAALTEDLVLGTISPEVRALQVLLNAHGYILAADGPGSPGEETTKFGALTRVAVRKFQCDQLHLCSGDEGTTGYGMVGASTRGALLALAAGSAPVAASTNISDATESDESTQIAALQKQIADLTAQLIALKQKMGLNS